MGRIDDRCPTPRFTRVEAGEARKSRMQRNCRAGIETSVTHSPPVKWDNNANKAPFPEKQPPAAPDVTVISSARGEFPRANNMNAK